MILDVPVINEDGSVKLVAHLTPEQTQVLLQFSIAYLLQAGLVKVSGEEEPELDSSDLLAQMEPPLND